MRFVVRDSSFRVPNEPTDQVYLKEDNWNDWWKWQTAYTLIYVDDQGEDHYIGSVKIGEVGLDGGRPSMQPTFRALPPSFFSLGQDVSYYENLNALRDTVRNSILMALNDVALNLEAFETGRSEPVMTESLLRSVSLTSVKGQFRRLANGDSSLSTYNFTYQSARFGNVGNSVKLAFHVVPESYPPTNLHVLIGRNGVGKTTLLNNMVHSLIDSAPICKEVGRFASELDEGTEDLFANVVYVSFSAFDSAGPPKDRTKRARGIKYVYVGIKKRVKRKVEGQEKAILVIGTKNLDDLRRDFVSSLLELFSSGRSQQWMRAVRMLEVDPMFANSDVTQVAGTNDEDDLKLAAASLFKRLSAGHRLVLLSITRLVQTVEERTLVLLDEPEGHLHPPLLSAFIRALSDLLIRRNAVAIIATHSPVILQEVPRSCIQILRRRGAQMASDSPQLETFGESIGSLTREVFGLEVTNSGFHKMLADAVEQYDDYDEVVAHFSKELGLEAKAIVRSLLAVKREKNGRQL